MRPESARAPEGWDAVVSLPEDGALALLAQAEPEAAAEPATVVGDLAPATTLLGWFSPRG